jgi:hypothetical protein
MHTWGNSGPESMRRRSQRVMLSIPVTLSGQTSDGPFTEQTQTLVINAHGALVMLAARVTMGQKLELKSLTHAEAQTCTVVFVGLTTDGRTQFGVEFTAPAPNFWQIAFPPQDWSAATLDDGARAENTVKK